MKPADSISRRDFFRFRLRGNSATPKSFRPAPKAVFPILRPPGAIPERAFLTACTKCGDCMTACPHEAIANAPLRFREAAGTPMIDSSVSPCRMCEDMPCIASCSTGALSMTAPRKMGTARISTFDCLAYQGGFCSVCVEQCPVENAIALCGGRPVINEQKCTGCSVCQYVCPAPRNAILVMPEVDRGRPIHLRIPGYTGFPAVSEKHES